MHLTAQDADRRAPGLSHRDPVTTSRDRSSTRHRFHLDVLVGRADPTDASLEYAATLEGVYKSTDGGDTWSRASHGLDLSAITSVIPDPGNNWSSTRHVFGAFAGRATAAVPGA